VKVPVSWLREFAEIPPDRAAAEVASTLAACGFAIESITGDVIDVEVTANRPDCLSVYGLAREVATAFDVALKKGPDRLGNTAGAAGPLSMPVAIESELCSRYALAVADVTVGPSPAWLTDRLVAAGVRPVNNVVDVTNYAMVERGHPLHAFDAAKLAGPEIHVRAARAGERLTTLDGQTRTLGPSMLVIADRDRAVAIAGVMGGAASEVSRGTRRIAIESAWFQPASVRLTSRALALKTEASIRFERGADIGAPVAAAERTLALLEQIGAGRAAGPIGDAYPRPAAPRTVPLARAGLQRLLGAVIPDPDIERILTKLGFTLASHADGWQVRVPTFRVDVTRDVDLIEEIARHWGFDKIPPTIPALTRPPAAEALRDRPDRRLASLLRGAGLQEAVTFTFMERAAAEPFVGAPSAVVDIANPLSEKFAVLRPSLLPGLLDALVYNHRRESGDVRLFEIGSVFGPGGERPSVGWVLAGARGEHWSGNGGPIDFFDARGVAELVATALGVRIDLEVAAMPADESPWLAPGRAARLVWTAAYPPVEIAQIGQLRPGLVAARGLGPAEAVFGGEIDLRAFPTRGSSAMKPLAPPPRYPSVVRDLSIVIDERLPAATVRGTIRANAPATLVSVREFDRYQGKGVRDGRVSLSVRLTFRGADRTLTDSEVQRAVDAIVAALAQAHGAILRGAAEREVE
jgi:phenylalanyl-tRNA synthetase beta chain